MFYLPVRILSIFDARVLGIFCRALRFRGTAVVSSNVVFLGMRHSVRTTDGLVVGVMEHAIRFVRGASDGWHGVLQGTRVVPREPSGVLALEGRDRRSHARKKEG